MKARETHTTDFKKTQGTKIRMPLSRFLHSSYRMRNGRIRWSIINALKRLEGGEFYSPTLRQIFRDYPKIDIVTMVGQRY